MARAAGQASEVREGVRGVSPEQKNGERGGTTSKLLLWLRIGAPPSSWWAEINRRGDRSDTSVLTGVHNGVDNQDMNTLQSCSADLMGQLEEAVRRAASGVRDVEAMQKACERMDRMREENRKRFGIQNVAVDLIRDARQ